MAVRADRRERRAGKKALKDAFKDAGKRLKATHEAARAADHGLGSGVRVTPLH